MQNNSTQKDLEEAKKNIKDLTDMLDAKDEEIKILEDQLREANKIDDVDL